MACLLHVFSLSKGVCGAFVNLPAFTLLCGRGGTGRRAALRSLSGNTGGSSSLLGRTIFIYLTAILRFAQVSDGAAQRAGDLSVAMVL